MVQSGQGPAKYKKCKKSACGCRYGVNAKQYFEEYLPGPKRTVFHTKKGLSWRNAWGVLRYSANNAFLALVHSAQMKEQVRAGTCQLCSHSLKLF